MEVWLVNDNGICATLKIKQRSLKMFLAAVLMCSTKKDRDKLTEAVKKASEND